MSTGVVRCPMPSCGGVMVKRKSRTTGADALGCDQYPECRAELPLLEAAWMREAGVPELPLFDDSPESGRG